MAASRDSISGRKEASLPSVLPDIAFLITTLEKTCTPSCLRKSIPCCIDTKAIINMLHLEIPFSKKKLMADEAVSPLPTKSSTKQNNESSEKSCGLNCAGHSNRVIFCAEYFFWRCTILPLIK